MSADPLKALEKALAAADDPPALIADVRRLLLEADEPAPYPDDAIRRRERVARELEQLEGTLIHLAAVAPTLVRVTRSLRALVSPKPPDVQP